LVYSTVSLEMDFVIKELSLPSGTLPALWVVCMAVKALSSHE
jgi:hypothetical protein